MKVEKGTWVKIYDVVLQPNERAPQLPNDTKEVPLEMWVRGFLQEDANIGDIVVINTINGRSEKGRLVEVNPHYEHDFGKFVPELLQIGLQLREILWGGGHCE